MSLSTIRRQVVSCQQCARLRAYCARIAQEKKAAHRSEDYWGKPIPGFGDRRARLLILGLAPTAHGANRTGRMFTGDRSGDFLLSAMCKVGLANLSRSERTKASLKLTGAYLTTAVRCASPENKPASKEIRNCQSFLEAELTALPQVKVIVALGTLAYKAYWNLPAIRAVISHPHPRFSHGLVLQSKSVPSLVASYHPNQQNTITSVLTASMLIEVLIKAKELAGLKP